MYAYHTYPGYGQNLNPESMDYGAYSTNLRAKLRELVTNYPGMRKDIQFWDDEFNSIPSWNGSDESVQAKYVPRGIIYNHAAGVKTFVWLLAAGVDGNEYDDFGFIHGITNPETISLRGRSSMRSKTQTRCSRIPNSIIDQITGSIFPLCAGRAAFPFLTYGFRNQNGKAIMAYWLAAHSVPGGVVPLLLDISS